MRRGTYVEGYAVGSAPILIYHAWVTIDDVHCIDVTWPDPERSAYFGVPIQTKVLAKLLLRDRTSTLSPLQLIVFGKQA
jgi:hypothetical protein